MVRNTEGETVRGIIDFNAPSPRVPMQMHNEVEKHTFTVSSTRDGFDYFQACQTACMSIRTRDLAPDDAARHARERAGC
jgi:hypothetical protein